MKIKINDKLLYIIFENNAEEKLITKFTEYKDTSSAFAGGRYNPMFVTNKKLGKIIKGIFVSYAGLAKEIICYCKDMDIKITEYKDERTHYDFQKEEFDLKSFFDPKHKYVEHQTRALTAMLQTNTGIIKATTSAGKSSIISAYIRATNMPTLILVNKVTLAQQLQNSFIKDGIDCGICTGQGIKSGTCMVSTIQSVKKVPNLLDYKCLIVDEIHQGSSTSFQEFFGSVSYPYKFGFSATPEGSNDYKFALVRQFFGSIIEEIGAEELMKNEVIAIPDINFIPVECPQTMDWQSAYEQAIVFNKDRNKKIIELAEKARKEEKQILIIIKSIEHGEILKQQIPDAVFVNGRDTPPDERMKVIEKFEKGEIKTIICSSIFNEGISIVNIHMLIIASGMKGYTESSQKLGRALRIGDDKKTALVYDFLDKGNRFTEKHSKRRASIYKKAGFKVSISELPPP